MKISKFELCDFRPMFDYFEAEKEKKKMRGKNKSLKRYLRKQRKNVIDPRAVSSVVSVG